MKRFPTAHTVLLLIAALVAIATWFLPAGKFEQLKYVAHENKDSLGSFVHISQAGEATNSVSKQNSKNLRMAQSGSLSAFRGLITK